MSDASSVPVVGRSVLEEDVEVLDRERVAVPVGEEPTELGEIGQRVGGVEHVPGDVGEDVAVLHDDRRGGARGEIAHQLGARARLGPRHALGHVVDVAARGAPVRQVVDARLEAPHVHRAVAGDPLA